MDLLDAFSDGEAPADVFAGASSIDMQADTDAADFLAGFSDGEEMQAESEALQVSTHVDVGQAQLVSQANVAEAEAHQQVEGHRGYVMRGKVGKGRHGGVVERALVCAHMRSEKRAKRAFADSEAIVQAPRWSRTALLSTFLSDMQAPVVRR